MTAAAVTVAAAARRQQLVRALRWALAVGAAAGAVAWIAYKAHGDMPTFVLVTLNGLTLAGLLFVVASGFTLVFGVMRVVNMAHGSFYLLGGYVAFDVMDSTGNFLLSLLAGAGAVAVVGLVVQQLLLRWNQGEELRQALITIALAIILADQMLAHFGATPELLSIPTWLDRGVAIHVYALQYPLFRLSVLGLAVALGILLWLWIAKTRLGMTIRAGVDDRQMVSALGINIQLVFAVAFLVGAALAGLGGGIGVAYSGIAPGEDAKFLLNSLVVVIVGGMGSLGGAATGALLLGLVTSYSQIYLPTNWTNYSILFTFVLMVVVLALRPFGVFGRPA
ncbi:MAG TPA: branched-chain amino acid ABC transporter permease [Gaiellaceae bacterium]